MLGFCVVFLLSGCNSTKKEEAEPSRSVSLAPETSSSQISESTVSSASQSSSTTESSSKAQLTDAQKGQMNQAFLDWAGGRAVIGNMAVSYWFFDHGAAGRGDWYANTPDGQVQVQNNGVPGKMRFLFMLSADASFIHQKTGALVSKSLWQDHLRQIIL